MLATLLFYQRFDEQTKEQAFVPVERLDMSEITDKIMIYLRRLRRKDTKKF